MDAATERMAEGLKKAIQAEIDGYHFYMMAARSTSDEKGREVFEKLARDEMDHMNWLKAHYTSLLETGKADPGVKGKPPTRLEGDHPIFSEGLKERAGGANYEMSALSIGAQLELTAIRFYTEEAEAATDEGLKRFYLDLVEWERGHYEALNRQLESLRGEHWEIGGFSPF
jgi:rubrerythrin